LKQTFNFITVSKIYICMCMYILITTVYIRTALFIPCTLLVACLLKTPSYVTGVH
jgi:hypothetical protein